MPGGVSTTSPIQTTASEAAQIASKAADIMPHYLGVLCKSPVAATSQGAVARSYYRVRIPSTAVASRTKEHVITDSLKLYEQQILHHHQLQQEHRPVSWCIDVGSHAEEGSTDEASSGSPSTISSGCSSSLSNQSQGFNSDSSHSGYPVGARETPNRVHPNLLRNSECHVRTPFRHTFLPTFQSNRPVTSAVENANGFQATPVLNPPPLPPNVILRLRPTSSHSQNALRQNSGDQFAPNGNQPNKLDVARSRALQSDTSSESSAYSSIVTVRPATLESDNGTEDFEGGRTPEQSPMEPFSQGTFTLAPLSVNFPLNCVLLPEEQTDSCKCSSISEVAASPHPVCSSRLLSPPRLNHSSEFNKDLDHLITLDPTLSSRSDQSPFPLSHPDDTSERPWSCFDEDDSLKMFSCSESLSKCIAASNQVQGKHESAHQFAKNIVSPRVETSNGSLPDYYSRSPILMPEWCEADPCGCENGIGVPQKLEVSLTDTFQQISSREYNYTDDDQEESTYDFSTLDSDFIMWMRLSVKDVSQLNQNSPLVQPPAPLSAFTQDELSACIDVFNTNTLGIRVMHLNEAEHLIGTVRIFINLIKPVKMSLQETLKHMSSPDQSPLDEVVVPDRLVSFFLPRGGSKLLQVTDVTTSQEVIQCLLDRFHIQESTHKFALYEHTLENTTIFSRKLLPSEQPFLMLLQWARFAMRTNKDLNIVLQKKRVVLQENENWEINWSEFTPAELLNFLRILEKEEADYRNSIYHQYGLVRQLVEQRIAALTVQNRLLQASNPTPYPLATSTPSSLSPAESPTPVSSAL